MGKKQKTGKNRQDKYYDMAKQQGFRARSAFKLIQLNRKYDFLSSARCVVDLCAAPGGWCQVASKAMPVSSLIIGVDIVPMKPMPNVICLHEDITTEKCRQAIRREMKHFKADCVLHDGAPNVGQNRFQDFYSQNTLTLKATQLATEVLSKGATYVTKVFRSKDYNNLLWVLKQLFEKVDQTKPKASRDESAEIFVVCRGYLAPDKIDPKLLDPTYVFADVDTQLVNRDIFHPERNKKAPALGYDTSDNKMTTFNSVPAVDFITATDPINVLGAAGSLTFTDAESSLYPKHPDTTEDVNHSCADLRVLGKRDFRRLLKWRLSMREAFHEEGASSSAGARGYGTAAVEGDSGVSSGSDESDVEGEVNEAQLAMRREQKRKIRKERRKKRLEQMKIDTKQVIVGDSYDIAEDVELFSLRKITSKRQLESVDGVEGSQADFDGYDSADENMVEEEEEEEALPSDIDSDDEYKWRRDRESEKLYQRYVERTGLEQKKMKLEAKAKRKHNANFDNLEAFESEDEEEGGKNPLLANRIDDKANKTATEQATAAWFTDDAFGDISASDDDDDDAADAATSGGKRSRMPDAVASSSKGGDDDDTDDAMSKKRRRMEADDAADEAAGLVGYLPNADGGNMDGVELVLTDTDDDLDESDFEEVPLEGPESHIEADPHTLAMAEAMLSRKKRHEMEDDAFNRYAFNDTGAAPTWFKDEEGEHTKKNLPVTKAQVDEWKAHLKEVNSRSIKKVIEAKGRKKMQFDKKLARAMRRATAISENQDLNAHQKTEQMERVLRKGKKKLKRAAPSVVVVRKGNATSGRPSGAGKGRYIAVDGRMRKELNAYKRREKKKKFGTK